MDKVKHSDGWKNMFEDGTTAKYLADSTAEELVGAMERRRQHFIYNYCTDEEIEEELKRRGVDIDVVPQGTLEVQRRG